MNTFSRVSIFGALFFIAAIVWLLWFLASTPYATEAGVIHEQPVPFSHQHHVEDAGIDCRYCHTSVEDSSFAGIPSTEICMNCHAFLFNDQPMLAPVRESFRTGQPLVWTRVHDVPDFANFNHSIHIHKGIGCVSCHGRVDKMPLMWREHSLLMQWCLDCHNNPVEHVRPREFVFRMELLEELAETEEFAAYLQAEFPDEFPEMDLLELRAELADRYGLEKEEDDIIDAEPNFKAGTNCSNCHW